MTGLWHFSARSTPNGRQTRFGDRWRKDCPVNQAELLRYVVETLEELGIDYMIGGSQASIYYGEPRFTQDIDIVADMAPTHVPLLLERFALPNFDVSKDAVREAITRRGQFSIIHPASGLKIDVILKKDTPYDRIQFERRQRQPLIPGTDAYFARPEDVILYKMLSFKEGRSERHLRDIAGMLAISGAAIDAGYVEEWAQRLGVSDVWKAIVRRAAEG